MLGFLVLSAVFFLGHVCHVMICSFPATCFFKYNSIRVCMNNDMINMIALYLYLKQTII